MQSQRPLWIGFIVSTALYGVTLGQTVYYYLSFPEDNRATKCLVAMFFLMETVHEAMIVHSQWWYLVAECNGDSNACLLVNWSIMFQACPTLLISFMGQVYVLHSHFSVLQVTSSVYIQVLHLEGLAIPAAQDISCPGGLS
ncbi:hypothetical protein NEOLEDRAFT_805387 [Neolentinus lepideus HHB14362 ss-1]|uniref:XK-related protein n=1 Tax=Neolentinus lepideus HHB14362 ss-1 TaxID=1314782 RepID=A0A165PFF9_9AGAM|nr:hypothetical protein NEOLEDRAFT_805387 [Neolentinus lepideus HHB14362 ss-1]